MTTPLYTHDTLEFPEGGLGRGSTLDAEFAAIAAAFAALPGPSSLGPGFDGPVYIGDAVNNAQAVGYGQMVTYVNSVVSGGGSPSSIAITALGVGTATANQVVRINGAGTAVVGDMLDITDLGIGAAAAFDEVRVNSAGTAFETFAPDGIPIVRNAVATNNAAFPASKIDFTSADLVQLYSATKAPVIRRTVGLLTCDTGGAGPVANGRDQAGAFGANDWVHFFYIWKPATSTLATLASLSSTAPTLPSGYTHFAFICSFPLSAGVIPTVFLRGNLVSYGSAGFIVLSASATARTSFSITTAAPPTAKSVQLNYAFVGRLNQTDGFNLYMASSGGASFSDITVDGTTSVPSAKGAVQPLPYQSAYYYLVTNASDLLIVDVSGYTVSNGG